MQIKTVSIKKLKSHPKNPRVHPDSALERLTKSIEEFGWTNPVLVSKDGYILAGHARVKAAEKAGLKEVPVIYLDLEGEKAEAYMIADNRLQELTDWDYPLLKDLLESLDTGIIDMEVTGFDLGEIEDLMTQFNPDHIEEDDFDAEAEARRIKQPASKVGDLYLLDNHKLACGDSTTLEPYQAILNDNVADLVFTDPPYNVNYKGTKSDGILNDNMSEEQFVDFSLAFMERMRDSLKIGGVFYICSGWSSYPIFLYAIKAFGLDFANPIVWVKNNTSMGWNDYRYKYEMVVKGKRPKAKRKKGIPILYGWNGGRHYFIDSRFESDIWEIKRKASNAMSHPTQKPLALVAKAIVNSSHKRDTVLDMFAGSGVTLIACEKTERSFVGIELDPRYCDVIIQRWQNYTGKEAVKV